MLEPIITNPIETANGYKNPDHGISLRGPLSQFFSTLFLKPLDNTYDKMDVAYIRYQDDLIVQCQSERQLKRAKQHMLTVLKERRLGLSSKKTRVGSIHHGFHFLGMNYLGTQTLDNITKTQDFSDTKRQSTIDQNIPNIVGGG
jgi:retron-type reverse transcriptase